MPCDCRGITAFANGNNIRIVGDLVRRTLTSRLDAKMETPEARTFEFDPVDYIKADRGKYLAAIFTIVRAYMAAGCPKVEGAPLGGFDGWSRMVRHPLLWLGMADPVKSTEEARKLDPVRAALSQRIAALSVVFGTGTFRAADIDHKINALNEYGRPKNEYPDLRDAFARPNGARINSRSIGNDLVKDVDRVSGRSKIKLASADNKNGNVYQIHYESEETAKAAEAEAKAQRDAQAAATKAQAAPLDNSEPL